MGDYRKYLRFGEKAAIVCLANGKQQAKLAFDYIRGAFYANPMLAPLVARRVQFGTQYRDRNPGIGQQLSQYSWPFHSGCHTRRMLFLAVRGVSYSRY